MAPTRDTLLLKLGAAKSQYTAAWRLIEVQVAQDGTLGFWLRKDKMREVCRREGRYLLRSNLCAEDPAQMWQLYILLTQIEEAFKTLKGHLAVRPIFHREEDRIEAHIFVAFLAFCLHVSSDSYFSPSALTQRFCCREPSVASSGMLPKTWRQTNAESQQASTKRVG